MESQIYENEKILFNNFINDYFNNSNKNKFFNDKLLTKYHIGNPIEFIIRPECNQQCKYCYITQYGQELYPIEERISKEQIITNFSLLLNHFTKNNLLLPTIELFAGDLFYDDLIYDLFEILYNYYFKIYTTESFYCNQAKEQEKNFIVIIPCNFSFVNNNKHTEQIKQWQIKFLNINVRISLSASVDGKYASEVRENKAMNIIDEYYNKILSNIFYLNAGIHSMISAESIDNAILNYDWWVNSLYQFNKDLPYDNQQDFIPYFLEVRNDNCWTEEKIDKYIELLQHMIKHRLSLCDNSIEKLTSHLFNKDNSQIKLYNPDMLKLAFRNVYEDSPCSFTTFLHINVQNLAIVPCHRLTYYHFIGGKFNVENNEIIDLEPINPSAYLGLITMNFSFLPKCDNCPLNKICLKGCLGAQYESSGEILIPCETVCNLFHAKYKTLLTEYSNLGILKEARKKGYLTFEQIMELKKIAKYFNLSLNLGEY